MKEKVVKYLSALSIREGSTVLITGGNSGIGKGGTEMLLQKGCKIIWAIRNKEKGEVARKELLEKYPEGAIDIRILDLASLSSIESFANKFIGDKIDVDFFYCNAGIYRVPFKKIYGGLESTVAVNFVSNLYLFDLLLPYLKGLNHPVKYIFTSSVVARLARFHSIDFEGGKRYSKTRSYNVSKTGVNMLFEYSKDECVNSNVLPLCVHPGVSYTPLIEKAYPNKKLLLLIKRFLRFFFNTPEEGALPALYVMQDKINESVFCGPRGLFHSAGFPKVYRLYQGNLHNRKEIIQEAKSRLEEAKKGE